MTRRFPKMVAIGAVAAALAVGGAGVAQASPDHGRTNDRPSTSHERHSGDHGRHHGRDRNRDRHHNGDRGRDGDRDDDGSRS